MLEDPYFVPQIFICPDVEMGDQYMFEEMERCEQYFKSKIFLLYVLIILILKLY